MANCAFLGLGVMGFPMAGHIAKTGDFSVSVYNRSQLKVERWLSEHEGSIFLPEDLFDIIVLCIGKDEDVLACELIVDDITSSASKILSVVC